MQRVDGLNGAMAKSRRGRFGAIMACLGMAMVFASVSACTSVARPDAAAQPSTSGVTVYGTVDAGVSHTEH